ncbi:hemerythrin domain-containing protein [Bradyrhizobium sp. LCT2]|uniref:hemerythrin domain-containing protein n=1 Tax=Bradyrhizobium sp. LCT2 TaxID=2493093 RepID=UPI00137534FB|nr:hypothetical protein [Bradyrhizobium sp. LCT2]
MIIDLLVREHRNIDLLLVALQRELEIFEKGIRPDYEVIRAIISYFEVYPEVYHHPQEDLIFFQAQGSRSGCGCNRRRSRA